MAIYKLYQDKRQTISGQPNPHYNKWYGKAVHLPRVVDTLELARRVQKNVSVKISDVYAVLREASDVINVALLNSERVKLDGIGSFKAAISTTPADTADEFKASSNIKQSRIIFAPELDPERTVAKSRKDKTLLRGIRWDKASAILAADSGEGGGGEGGEKPAAPTVSPTSGTSPLTVTISGLAMTPGQTNIVQRRKGSGNWTKVGDIESDSMQDTITDAAGGTYYYRQVVGGVAGDASVAVTVTVMP